MSHVIGIDTSTTATKAVVVSRDGEVVGSGHAEYAYNTPKALWSEQDPRLWTDATISAIRSAVNAASIRGDAVEAIGLAGQMHGLVVLGTDDQPLRPAILWNDQRTGPECDEIRTRVGRRRLIDITGNDALTGFTASKLLWVRNHEPDVWAQTAAILLPKDYVRLSLTGDHATDRAGGSGTQLFDLGTRTWSADVMDALEIDAGLLPPTFEGPETTGTLSTAAAASTGLPPGVPVVAGAGDQAANAVGTGVVDPGSMAISLGTSGVVFAATDRPAIDREGRVHAFCHAVPNRWHMMGVMLSAAGSLRWFRDSLAPGEAFETLVEEAEMVPPGADGLLFLPYLTGERTPHPDPAARGAFIGLTVRHTRGHLVRAILEGVAFGLADGLRLMRQAGVVSPEEVRASGGGTASSLWRQILADVLEVDIVSTSTAEGAAYGAAVLAASGIGWFPSVGDAVAGWVTTTGRTPRTGFDYRALHGLYREQYAILKPTFERLV